MIARCKIDTVQFRRKLGDSDRAILLAAGAGDITIGFQRVLEVYRYLHGLGLRQSDQVDRLALRNFENSQLNE